MKRYNKWFTAGVAVTMMGVLVGCGTAGNDPAPTTNITNTATTITAATNNVTNVANNTVSNKTTQNTTTTIYTNTTLAVDTQTLENQTGTWKAYTNDRFGFSVEYPSNWQMGPRPTDDDGRYFTTPSGLASFDNAYGSGVAKSDVVLLVVGTPNVVNGSGNGYNFEQMVAAFRKSLPNERKQRGFVLESYTIVPNKWIVNTLVTEVGHGGIQYSEMYTSLTTNQTITMIFPKSKSNAYIPFWNYLSKKFQPSNKNG